MFVLLLVIICGTVLPARAQDHSPTDTEFGHVVAQTARQVVLDPTTYTPAAILYTSMRLDWISSQPLFRSGYVETNPRYTQSGLTRDLPVSYSEGNHRILMDSLAVLPAMFVNNAASRLGERALTDRFPDHPKLIQTLGWIERISFTAYLSYRLSAGHFQQWQLNKRVAAQIGAQ